MSTEQFSTRHPFTQVQVEQAVAQVAKEGRGKRLLVNVTTAHRENAIHQWSSQQLAYWLAVIAILLVELMQPTISRYMLYIWFLAAVLSWGLRTCMYAVIFRAPPADVARSLVLRLIPLGIMAISLSYWIWTAHLFITSALTPTVVVLFMGVVMHSIALTGIVLTAPIAAGAGLIGLWLALSVRTIHVGLLPWSAVAIIDCTVSGVLWLSIHMTTRLIKPHLDRSDETDLLVMELRRTNAALETMRRDAAETLAKRSTFFAGASHDFRQRLHAMKLMAHSTIASQQEDDPSRQALTRLSEEMQELETYITHFLEFMRSETLNEKPRLEAVGLHSVFQQVDLLFEDAAAASDIRLRFRVTQVRLHTDAKLLLQMLENLVSNALKFSRGGVLIGSRRRGDDVLIEVWDQGEGIQDDQRSKIFDAFHQDLSTASRGERGVGLGLAIAKRCADRLGCSLTVASRVGRGSVFRIRIPAASVLAR
jgi:signal transduction histidine kinase